MAQEAACHRRDSTAIDSPLANRRPRLPLGRDPRCLGLPLSTYRLQFNAGFTFDDAAAIVDYLDALGDLALLRVELPEGGARQHARLRRRRSDAAQSRDRRRGGLSAWIDALRAHGMGHILDLVPNHMGIAQVGEPVVAGRARERPRARATRASSTSTGSRSSRSSRTRCCCRSSAISTARCSSAGDPARLRGRRVPVRYYETCCRSRRAPTTDPRHSASTVCSRIGADERRRSSSSASSPPSAPAGPATLDPNELRRSAIARRKCHQAAAGGADVERAAVLRNRARASRCSERRRRRPAQLRRARRAARRAGLPAGVLARGGEEINYRRFFDINELAAIRMEDPAVFERVHAYVLRAARGAVHRRLRIDHVDGLFDPGDYLRRLAGAAREAGRRLCIGRSSTWSSRRFSARRELPDWPVDGTTGYDFLITVNGLFVDAATSARINDVYERFTRLHAPFRRHGYRGKQLVLRVSMAGELNVLAPPAEPLLRAEPALSRLHAQQPDHAMREIIACFPVYRTYVNDARGRSATGPRVAHRARGRARPSAAIRTGPPRVFDFVRDAAAEARRLHRRRRARDEHMRFVGKFQQVTSPVTAKGIEDTALYIYNRLVSLNEVGGEPDRVRRVARALHAVEPTRGAAMAARAVGHVDARHQAQRGRARAAQRAVGAARAHGSRLRPAGRA